MIASLERAGKNDLLSLAFTFASLVFQSEKDRDWLRKRFSMLSDDILEDSWGYQEAEQTFRSLVKDAQQH